MPPAGSGFQSDNTGHLCSSLISARPWLDGPEAAAAPPPPPPPVGQDPRSPPLAPASSLPSGSGKDRSPASFSLVQLQRRLHSQEATTPAHPGPPDPPQLPRGPAGRPRAWAPGGAGREGSRATLWALPRLNQVIGAQRASSPESQLPPRSTAKETGVLGATCAPSAPQVAATVQNGGATSRSQHGSEPCSAGPAWGPGCYTSGPLASGPQGPPHPQAPQHHPAPGRSYTTSSHSDMAR